MILKLLIIGAVITAVYFMFFKTKPETKVSKKASKTTKNTKQTDADEMVECATCGIYAEVEECILSNGRYYCSRECLTKAK